MKPFSLFCVPSFRFLAERRFARKVRITDIRHKKSIPRETNLIYKIKERYLDKDIDFNILLSDGWIVFDTGRFGGKDYRCSPNDLHRMKLLCGHKVSKSCLLALLNMTEHCITDSCIISSSCPGRLVSDTSISYIIKREKLL